MPISIPRNTIVRLCGTLAGVLFWFPQPAESASLDYSSGGTAVRITAVSPTVFRISVNGSGHVAGPIDSIYLDPDFHPGDVGTAAPGAAGHHELRTGSAVVDLDETTGSLSLRNAQGQVLIPSAPLVGAAAPEGTRSIALRLGWPGDRPFDIYGCGNGSASLVQHQVKAHVDNGIAVEPFFWAPAGYATFVVGSDSNAPAQCDGKAHANAITWLVPGSSADIYLMVAPTLGDAARELVNITGKPPVPPRWTLGYLQSRWGWTDMQYIQDVQQQFQSRHLPVDAFIFDFEWYTTFPDYEVKWQGEKDFSDFGWNAKLFPTPASQLQALHQAGIHFVGIRKPRLGNSDSLKMIRSKDWDFRGGTRYDARDLQFNNPALRAWYSSQIQPLLRAGVDGWWDDEGEFTYTTYTYWNAAERAALDAVRPTDRLWTLDRAFQPGSSRWGAAAWTGDIHANWEDFAKTPTDLLNWSVAGMPYDGCDIGGFKGETNPQLLVRWMEAGTFFPVMRTHSEITVKPHFPWLFGPDAEAAIRKTLELRYRLVPALYSLAHQNHATGEPIMRPLVMQYPTDPKVADLSSEWLLGPDLLAAPILTPADQRTIYLPNDTWYDFASGQRVAGGQELSRNVPFDAVPLYVRAGSILPLAPLVQHTRDLPGGPLELNIYPGRDGKFTLVEDDGISNAYLSGNLRQTEFRWDDAGRTLTWKRTGAYDGADCFRSMRVLLHDGTPHDAVQQDLSGTGSVKIQ